MTSRAEAPFDPDPLTDRVIGCVFRVSNTLGAGFLEKVYENALRLELRRAGLEARRQVSAEVRYRGEVVGTYVADIVVEGRLLLELKACRALDQGHTAQCLNYLKATGIPTCLLVNFGSARVQIKRLVS